MVLISLNPLLAALCEFTVTAQIRGFSRVFDIGKLGADDRRLVEWYHAEGG